MLTLLNELDEKIFFLINKGHNPYVDQLMAFISTDIFFVLSILPVFLLLIAKYKQRALAIIVMILSLVLICDQYTSSFLKPFVKRLRPTHKVDIKHLVHTVNGYKGGLYGFASSHAANSFGIATSLFFFLRNFYKKIYLLFAWALLISYSRIYLGVHYPGDIIIGAFSGIKLSILFYWLYAKLQML